MGKDTRKWIIGIAIAILLYVIYRYGNKGQGECSPEAWEMKNRSECSCDGWAVQTGGQYRQQDSQAPEPPTQYVCEIRSENPCPCLNPNAVV
jgi:hypothetical protein